MNMAADQQNVAELGRVLVGSLAPAELPLFAVVSRAFFDAGGRVPHARGGGDEVLGFGAGEVAALLTPAALAAASAALGFLAEVIRSSSAKAAVDLIDQQIRHLIRREPAALALTREQLSGVRGAAFDAARRLKLREAEAALLADTLVGCLAVGRRPE